MHAVNRVVKAFPRQITAKNDANNAADESRNGQRGMYPYPSRSKLLEMVRHIGSCIDYTGNTVMSEEII